MAEKPIDNPTGQPRYVAGRLIPPGETRLIPEEELPPHLKDGGSVDPETTDDVDDESLKTLLERSESEITEGLARLSDRELDRLRELEQESEKPREDVLATIAGERQKPRRDPGAPAGTAAPGTLQGTETDHKTQDEAPEGETSNDPSAGSGQAPATNSEQDQDQDQDQDQPLQDLLERTVPEIKEAITKLSADELDRLEQLEDAAEKPRKGVQEAIAEERLTRGSGG